MSAFAFSQNSELRIGKSTSDKLQRNKAAQIVGTFPNNDTIPNSWLVDGFIEYSRKDDILKGFEFGVFVEVHKNTLIAKRQDVQQFGLTAKRSFDILPKATVMLNMYNTFTIRDSKDFVKDKNEFIGLYGTTFKLWNRPKEWMRFLQVETGLIDEKEDKSSFSDILNITHSHNLGLGYVGNNDVILANAAFELNVFPLSSLFYKKKFRDLKQSQEFQKIEEKFNRITNSNEATEGEKNEITSKRNKKLNEYKKQAGRLRNIFYISWTVDARSEIIGKLNRDIQTLNKIVAGINYNISDKSAIGLAYLWQEGANPYTSLENQSFSTLTAQFKILL